MYKSPAPKPIRKTSSSSYVARGTSGPFPVGGEEDPKIRLALALASCVCAGLSAHTDRPRGIVERWRSMMSHYLAARHERQSKGQSPRGTGHVALALSGGRVCVCLSLWRATSFKNREKAALEPQLPETRPQLQPQRPIYRPGRIPLDARAVWCCFWGPMSPKVPSSGLKPAF